MGTATDELWDDFCCCNAVHKQEQQQNDTQQMTQAGKRG